MPNFDVKERAAPPHAPEPDSLPQWSDGTSVNVWYHRHKTHTVQDVIAPGYFNFMRENFRSGNWRGVVNYVKCFLGDIDDGMTVLDLHLVDAPSASAGDVIMAKGASRKFTPVRHAGGLAAEDRPQVADGKPHVADGKPTKAKAAKAA